LIWIKGRAARSARLKPRRGNAIAPKAWEVLMVYSPETPDETWLASIGASITCFAERVAQLVDDWRARERLRRELDDLSVHGELDTLLHDVGLTRSDISSLVAACPGASQRLDAMAARLGADRSVLKQAGELHEAEWRCTHCPDWRRCRSWLATAPAGMSPPTFCPNRPSFERARSCAAATHLAAIGQTFSATGERAGLLAELAAAHGEFR
jgi:uncharacterized protein YjiS (DUF1127 family)